jgi:hypothetical protein
MVSMANRNQNIETPISFVCAVEKFFNIKFDVDLAASSYNKKAPNYFDESTNSLSIAWPLGGYCWLNPPFKRLTLWVNKCSEQVDRGCHIFSIWPLSGDSNQIISWKKAGINIIHGRIWPEVRGCMLCEWSAEFCTPYIRGLSWDKKELKEVWKS